MTSVATIKRKIENLERRQIPLAFRMFWLDNNGTVSPGNTTEEQIMELAEKEGFTPVFLGWRGELSHEG